MESRHEVDTNTPYDDPPPVEIILDEPAGIDITDTLYPGGIKRLNKFYIIEM